VVRRRRYDARAKVLVYAQARKQLLCVPKIRFGVDAAGGRRKLAS
jgi:hypothetical protein